ncbi:MAG: hypothetical protein RR933_06920 [Oscillospiraceae bacterium]
MQCILHFVQNERTNLVGVFQSRDNAIDFLRSIPFLQEKPDEFGTTYTIKFEDMPDSHTINYNGWQYVLSRFSYSAYKSDGIIEAYLTDVCNLDSAPPENGSYIPGYTCVDAYSFPNSEVADTIEKREAFYQEAERYYAEQGRTVDRDGLGSEDGEYVLVSAPGNPSEMHLTFLLDPQTIADWESSGSFALWLKQNELQD